MSLTLNSARQLLSAGVLPGPTKRLSAGPHQAGLSISPEGKTRRADRSALLALVALGMGFLFATTLFAAALISLALS
ncbi:MAG: hypothetical protein FJX32_06455 [Alphaproteobacteria bacterium]|nr:hypothetical protein [Alphaproteobacteria bacterium]